MHKGDYFVNRQTGRRVKVVESMTVRDRGAETQRFRMSDSTLFLDARQVQAQYAKVVATEPAKAAM